MSQIHRKTLHSPIQVAGLQIRINKAAAIDGAGRIGPLFQRSFARKIQPPGKRPPAPTPEQL
jgi:hypothetical protein